MKKQFIKALVVLMIPFIIACDDDKLKTLPVGTTLTGEWIVTEGGASNGHDYVTTAVSPDPAQTITFNASGEVASTIESFASYHYYRVVTHPGDPEIKILVLFETTPTTIPDDINTLSPAYIVEFTDSLLKLSFRGCIEGCHIGLKRIANPPTEQ